MEYKILINDFEGPMDLLLHLIKQSDIDIYDIKIEEITKQYFDYIETMEELNLNIASEYLVMAAELMEIKSSMLLPKDKNIVEDEEDPRDNLIKRLIEYKKYKEICKNLKELELERKDLYTKELSDLNQFKSESTEINISNIDMENLVEAFKKFLNRKELEKPVHTKITKREYSVKARSDEIKKILKLKERVNFEDLFEVVSKDYVVVTFLSILDLVRKQEAIVNQDITFGQITLALKDSGINE